MWREICFLENTLWLAPLQPGISESSESLGMVRYFCRMSSYWDLSCVYLMKLLIFGRKIPELRIYIYISRWLTKVDVLEIRDLGEQKVLWPYFLCYPMSEDHVISHALAWKMSPCPSLLTGQLVNIPDSWKINNINSQHLPCARHCFKFFVYINSLILLTRYILLLPVLQKKETVIELAQGSYN